MISIDRNRIFKENKEWFFEYDSEKFGPFPTKNIAVTRLAEHFVALNPGTDVSGSPKFFCQKCADKLPGDFVPFIMKGTCNKCGKEDTPLWRAKP